VTETHPDDALARASVPGVVRAGSVPAEVRPRFVKGERVASLVQSTGNAGGLTQMGVAIRSIEPDFHGSNRHFHTVEEEWVYVLSGTGVARIGPHRVDVRAGHFLGYPPGPRPHDFLATGDAPLVFLEGGERRPAEERGFYVDMGLVFGGGRIEAATGPPPPEEGTPNQCLHVDDREIVAFDHPVDPSAHRAMRRLAGPTGLVRQSVTWARVRAGDRSTAFHTHTRTDEWIYVLAGRAALRIGDARVMLRPGDFVAHPARGHAHAMQAETELTYLMGGQRDADDVVLYPEHRLQLRQGALEPIPRGAR
jgi:uncharacterized cupin superfamily protein